MAAPSVSAQGAIDAYLQSALADSEAFGQLSDLLLDESDADMASTLSNIEGAGGTDNPAIYWALQMALADRFGTPRPMIADQTTAQQAQDIYSQYGDGLRDYVDAVHTATQQYFGDYGVSEVTAYHGLNYPHAPDGLHFDMAARNANMALSGITVYSQDPAAVIAGALASQNGLSPNLAHIIAAQQVPIADVWSVNGDGSLRILPSASEQPSLYVGWEADSPGDTWAPDPSIVSGLLEPLPDALGGESGVPPPPTTTEQPAMAESPPGDIYQQTWDYRQQLLEGVMEAQQKMIDAYAGALEQINAQMLALAKKIQDAQLNHEEVDPMWLAREQSLAQLYIDIEDRMSQAGQQAHDALAQAMNDAANLGVATGNAQLNAMIPNIDQLLAKAGVDTLWGQPSEQALQNMVGAGQDPNSPLNMAFGALGQAAIDLIKHGLFNGLALGQNPLTVASNLAGQVEDLTLSRANAIARNEMLRAYRTANLMSYQENSDVVDGWVWVAALSTNTCAFCWAENGGFHSSDETLDSHVSCACVMVPVTGDWSSVLSDLEEAGLDESDLEEMGIDFSEIEDTTVQVPSGEEIFAKQPPDVQEKVLGPGKYALYQNGDLSLQDLVGHYHDEQWGGVGYEKSLKDLGFTPDDIAAAKAAIEAKANEPAPPTHPLEQPSLTPTQIADQAGARVRAAEEEARQAIEAAKTPPTTILGKIKAWADIHFKIGAADQAWRAEIDAIDKRLLAQRIAQQKLERGAGPLTPQVEEAAKRLLEERYRQAKSDRGVNPLTEEVRQIEQRQREQRIQKRKEGQPPAFSAKPREEQPAAPVKTYTLTAEDKAFAASIREQIGPEGVLDHEQAIEIGRQIQERIADQTQPLAGWAEESRSIYQRAPDLTDQERAWAMGEKDAVAAHGGVKWTEAQGQYQADYRAKTIAYLAEIRGDEGMGGEIKFDMSGDKADEFVRSQLSEAARLLPSDWIKASNDLGEISPIRNRATNSSGWYQGEWSFERGNADIALSYNKQSDPLAIQTVALHELMHRMEIAVPRLGQLEDQFYRQRTAGETPQRLTNGIGDNTKVDQWLDEYLGTVPHTELRPEYMLPEGFPARTAVNYELLSNGADMALGHVPQAAKFAQDREFERFVLGSLAGVKARPMGEIPLAEGETGPARAARNPAPFHQVEEEQGQRSFAAKREGEQEAPKLEIESQHGGVKALQKMLGVGDVNEALARMTLLPEGTRLLVEDRGDGSVEVRTHSANENEDLFVDFRLLRLDSEAAKQVKLPEGSLVMTRAIIRTPMKTAEGGRALIDSLQKIREIGVQRIYADAIRGPGYNGYETWARLGAKGKIPPDIIKAAQAEFGPKIKTVQQLMETAEGRAWWRENGITFEAQMDLGKGGATAKILDRLSGRTVEKPTVTTERVNVTPVKPPRVRTLTAEQQAKRDAADAIKAAKAATTITKRGEALEISQGDMTARVEPDLNLGGYRLTIGNQEARPTVQRTGSVDLVGSGREMVNAIVGHAATDEEIASLIGAPPDARIKVIGQMQRDEGGRLTYGVIEMTGPKGAYTARRIFRELPNGDKVVVNQNIEIKKALQGQGLGTRILADQTSALRDLGFKEIQTFAKGKGEGGNGYYTWPRLGYDTPITPDLRADIEASAPIPKEFQGYTRLSQFMETPEGKAWWKEHGVGVNLTFDLTPGSRSNQMLDAYLRAKGSGTSAGKLMTVEGATLARVNALLKERLGYPGAVKATQIEPGPPKTAAEKKAYRESGVKNATTISKSENALRFTRPDGQAVTVERDMVNGGYKVTIGGETTEGLTIAKANALLKAILGYAAPLSKDMLAPGTKPRQPKRPKNV